VDVIPVAPAAAARAGQPVGVEQIQELVITGLFVHQVEDREVHGAVSRVIPPDQTTPVGGRKEPTTERGT